MQKQSIAANAAVENQQLEVELYNLRQRVNQMFFGILLVNEEDTLTEILKRDIRNGISKTNAAIANGTALKSSSDILRAELLKAGQHSIVLNATRKAYFEMLSQFMNQSLDENSVLKRPEQISPSMDISRPELSVFENQKKMIDVQDKLLRAKNQPKVGLFLQAGFGRPGLNMLKNDFAGYYMGGVRVNWSLSGLYTYQNDRALLENNRKSIDAEKETFLFNTVNTLQRQKEEIIKLQQLIQSDEEIIELRNRIKNTAMAQLEYGTINSGDYLREVNAEAEAKQSQLLHSIQLLMAQYEQQATTGN